MSDNRPMSGSVDLPVEFLESIGAISAAVKQAKKEIKELEKEARESLKHRGIIDESLEAKIHQTKQSVTDLETRKQQQDDYKEQEQRAMAADRKVEQAANWYAKSVAGMRKVATTGPSLSGEALEASKRALANQKAAGQILGISSHVSKVAGMTTASGATSAAVGSAMSYGMGAIRSNPYAAAIFATYQAGAWIYNDETDRRKKEAEAMGALSSSIMALTGAVSPTQDMGSEERAIRVSERLTESFNKGRAESPIGLFEKLFSGIASVRGDNSAQLERGKRIAEHEARMEEVYQQYGINNPIDENAVQAKAKLSYDRKYSLTKNWLGWAGKAVGYAYYGLTGQSGKYLHELENDEVMAARESMTGDIAHRRKEMEFSWNAGAIGALRRAMEYEKRRYLRDVETDRILRFNDWGMQ